MQPIRGHAKIQAMYLATDLLTAIERRHGPLHAILINWADQWRWKRQLAAIAKNPMRLRFSTLRVIHERILATTLEYTSPEALRTVKAAWQEASDAMANVADANELIWLANNRLA